jgi:hypothetical protein
MRRNIDSIRSLQSRWLTLGLHERMPRDQLLVKPFPPSDGGGWQSQIVRTLPLPQFVQTQWTFTQKARSAWG